MQIGKKVENVLLVYDFTFFTTFCGKPVQQELPIYRYFRPSQNCSEFKSTVICMYLISLYVVFSYGAILHYVAYNT